MAMRVGAACALASCSDAHVCNVSVSAIYLLCLAALTDSENGFPLGFTDWASSSTVASNRSSIAPLPNTQSQIGGKRCCDCLVRGVDSEGRT